MFKKVLAVTLSVMALFAFASCDIADSLLNDKTVFDRRHTFKVGEKASTMFFDFNVLSAEKVDEYDGITPSEDNQLITVVATVTNTFGKAIELYDDDFFLQWGKNGKIKGGVWPIEAIDDTMAPGTYYLANGATVEFLYVFEAPSEAAEFHFVYTEEYTEANRNKNKVGDFYSFSLPL